MSLFSIVTVTKNNPDGFARTRDSLKIQNYSDYQWIVQDGAIEPDAGIYDAMNKGMRKATGTYVMFLNAGDTFVSSDTLSTIAGEKGAEFLYGDAVEDGRIKPARHDITRGMITHHQAMLYRRDALDGLQYDTQYHIAADYKFTAQFLQRVHSRQYIPAPLCVFEPGGISQMQAMLGRREQSLVRKELGISAPGVEALQLTALTLKSMAPSAYWAMRKRFRTSEQ